MEKFLFLRLALFFILLPFSVNAQEYAVFRTSGSPIYIEGTKSVPIAKGSLLKAGKVTLASKDALVMVNNKGEVFEINDPGSYAVPNFGKFRKENSEENFTNKYFSYVWKQMSQKETTQTHTGNVYRDALVDVLKTPVDSTSIFKNEVRFSWETQKNNQQYYFFLENREAKTISKMKISGNSLTLYAGSNLLEKGNTYYWGVATTEYPDFTRIKMNQLNYLSNDQFQMRKKEIEALTQDLRKMGLSENEIDEQLCQYFKFCAN